MAPPWKGDWHQGDVNRGGKARQGEQEKRDKVQRRGSREGPLAKRSVSDVRSCAPAACMHVLCTLTVPGCQSLQFSPPNPDKEPHCTHCTARLYRPIVPHGPPAYCIDTSSPWSAHITRKARSSCSG
jgi:hypothetical protein